MDEFRVQCRNLGVLRALRVESDGKSNKPNWHLDMVVITAPTGEKYYFAYSNWLGPQNPMVELPASLLDPTLDRRWVGDAWQGSRAISISSNWWLEGCGDVHSSGLMGSCGWRCGRHM